MPPESVSAATEFVEQAFETAVSETAENELITAIDEAVGNLREQIDDGTLENILRADPGSYKLRSGMTRDGLQPESFTQQAVIEPLLDALGHVRARSRVHARTEVFLALCLRLVVAITNYERGNNPGCEKL